MSQIAVLGIGSFGHYLALKLAELGSEVLAMDLEENNVDRVKAYVAKAVVANATDKQVLRQLGVAGMDAAVISMGDDLEASILCALHLKELGAKNVVAKSISEDHAKILDTIGVQKIVFPERDMAFRVASSLHNKNIADFVPLGGDLSLIEMVPTDEMVGKSLIELDLRRKYQVQILAIKDKVPQDVTFVPSPDTKIKKSQCLVVMGKNEDLEKLRQGK